MAKRKPKYLKILTGMNCCYGTAADDRNCADCPYDKYNSRDFYGMGTSYCMEKLNEDTKKWTESMSTFTNCRDCCCFHPNLDENENYRFVEKPKDGFCSVWRCMMGNDEYCSRGGMKD